MLLTALLLLVVPQTAPAAPSRTVTVVAPNPNDPDQKICRREVPLGSVLPKKVCRTRAQWTQISRDTDNALNRVRGGSSSGTMCNTTTC